MRKIQAVTGASADRTVLYRYNLADALTGMTYPSGATVTYTRDATGRITGVTAQPTASAASVTLLSDVDYLPFGAATQFTFGNARTLTKSYDQNYAIDAVVDSGTNGVDIGYGVDAIGNITALGELLDNGTVAMRTVGYDGLNRVSSLVDGSTTVQGFTYDATGNRLSKTSGGTTANYTYQTGTHRLTNDGTSARTYDSSGNGTGIGTKTFAYDDHGRQIEYSANGVLTRKHLYNAFGARVARWHVLNPSNDMVFVYDEAGHIIGEYRTDGTRIREYVWMDDTPVAVLMSAGGSTHQYILTDHLNTPRAVVDPTRNAIIWRWDITTTAFGEHVADGDPDGDGNGYTLNLRYPGQFFDSITGVHYNYFRDYDPGVGRYVQSDPIGLVASMSSYGYVAGQPLRMADPLGLFACPSGTNPAPVSGNEHLYPQVYSCPGLPIKRDESKQCATPDCLLYRANEEPTPYQDCMEKCMSRKLSQAAAISGTSQVALAGIVRASWFAGPKVGSAATLLYIGWQQGRNVRIAKALYASGALAAMTAECDKRCSTLACFADD